MMLLIECLKWMYEHRDMKYFRDYIHILFWMETSKHVETEMSNDKITITIWR